MKYSGKVGNYPLVDVNIWGPATLEIFTPEERELVQLAGDIQMWQLGEGPMPPGMDRKQIETFFDSEILKTLARKADAWYRAAGGKKKALALPFLVGGKK